MALTEKQFAELKKQLEKKKQKLGDEEYSSFLERANIASQPKETEATDKDGFIMDTAQGVVKSAGDIALGAGTLGRKIQSGISKAGEKVFGKYNPFQLGEQGVFDEGSTSNVQAKELLKRDTAGEKLGGFVGDVASFALPGGAVTKATKGMGFLTRAASLGASDAVTTTVKQGKLDRQSVDAGIIAMAFPVVGKVASAAKPYLLPSGKEAGGRVINSLIKPLLKDFSYGKNPGQAVAEAGITANSLDDLATKIRSARVTVGEEISSKVAQSTSRFDATDALTPLDEALAVAQKSPKTNSAIIQRLQNLKDDLLQVDKDGLPTRNLKDLSADDLWELNKDIGELTRWTGNATDDEIVNKALRNAYAKSRTKLESGVAGLDEVSEKYANLKSAEIATEYRDKIAARQGLLSFTGSQAGLTTGLLTAVATGGVTVPLLVGAGVAGLTEASKTATFKTKLAAWLASTSKDELKDAFTQAPWLRGALQTILLDIPEGDK